MTIVHPSLRGIGKVFRLPTEQLSEARLHSPEGRIASPVPQPISMPYRLSTHLTSSRSCIAVHPPLEHLRQHSRAHELLVPEFWDQVKDRSHFMHQWARLSKAWGESVSGLLESRNNVCHIYFSRFKWSRTWLNRGDSGNKRHTSTRQTHQDTLHKGRVFGWQTRERFTVYLHAAICSLGSALRTGRRPREVYGNTTGNVLFWFQFGDANLCRANLTLLPSLLKAKREGMGLTEEKWVVH